MLAAVAVAGASVVGPLASVVLAEPGLAWPSVLVAELAAVASFAGIVVAELVPAGPAALVVVA